MIVAVMDDGFFYQHDDVKDNIWHNPGESGLDAIGRPKETNGVDDDGNGYVDNVVGYDFAFHDPDAYIFDGMDRDRIQPNWYSIPALDAVYPQAFRNENILRVAEVNFLGELDTNSGADRISASTFGRRTVHLAAIARNYTTAVRNGRSAYDVAGGTSNSAPVAAGVAALIFSIRPDLSGQQVKQILMSSVRRLPNLENKLVSGGVIDAYAALTLALRYQR